MIFLSKSIIFYVNCSHLLNCVIFNETTVIRCFQKVHLEPGETKHWNIACLPQYIIYCVDPDLDTCG